MWTKRKLWLFVLGLLFAASVLLRFGAFDAKAVSTYSRTWDRFTNNEVYLHTGYVFRVYDTHPFSEHKFVGYVGKSDKFLPRKGVPDLYVYTSFPPTMFVVPYAAFSLMHVSANMISLDVFNLVLQLVTIVLIFYLILAVLPRRDERRRNLIALLGASAYIFSTSTLHNHIDVYWAHQLLQPFFVGALLLFVRRHGIFRWWEAAIVGFTLSIITWTGVFGLAGMGMYSIYKLKKTNDRAYLWQALGLGGGSVLAVGLVLLQGILATGVDVSRYISTISSRAESRTIASGETPALLVRWFFNGLMEDFGGYIILAYTLAFAYVRRIKPRFEWAVVLIAAFPVLESFILLEHDTVYTFGRLKWLLPLILTLALLSYEFLERGKKQSKRQWTLVGLYTAAALFHVWLYIDMYGFTR